MPFHEYLRSYLPEFEERTGIKVAFDIQAFPIYNQRMDLELSTARQHLRRDQSSPSSIRAAGSAPAGSRDLDEFTSDANATPPDWDAGGFRRRRAVVDARRQGPHLRLRGRSRRDDPGAARGDLIEKAGLQLPTTFDELIKVCEAVHGKEGVAAWTADKLHHWNWMPYLMGMGGGVFKDPPDNLTPTLDTPVAAQAAQWYADLLTKYGPDGVLSYTDDQAMQSQLSGRANMRTQAITWRLPLAKNPDSKVKKTVRYGLMPAGPAGAFPGVQLPWFRHPRRLAARRARRGSSSSGRCRRRC